MSISITDSNFQELLSKNKFVAIDFWAEWCGPCKLMSPIIDEISEELKDSICIGKTNVDESNNLANRFRIRSIPTIIIFKDGEEIDRIVGFNPKKSIIDKIISHFDKSL